MGIWSIYYISKKSQLDIITRLVTKAAADFSDVDRFAYQSVNLLIVRHAGGKKKGIGGRVRAPGIANSRGILDQRKSNESSFCVDSSFARP